ncbi:hypothetical protein Sp245p_28090 (plasmid) [Azospirillum baldaniorum]|uniref:Uncharacterized protein n=1 Tax=Azospirillum baldaniorum TaxID=1064539 RepID=A0A9P1JXR7_9PROT|nr:hypothetical protein Sp245p_28090 [Azospirillum baldaniorum]CCD01813.1 protein of unknown function [Azospirillum baldaniorum]
MGFLNQAKESTDGSMTDLASSGKRDERFIHSVDRHASIHRDDPWQHPFTRQGRRPRARP